MHADRRSYIPLKRDTGGHLGKPVTKWTKPKKPSIFQPVSGHFNFGIAGGRLPLAHKPPTGSRAARNSAPLACG